MTNRMRTLSLGIALALLMTMLVGGGLASAQGETNTNAPGTWASSINIQNLETSTNNIQILFYSPGGTLVYTHVDAMDPQEGVSYYLPALSGISTGQYAAVVSSSGRVKAVVNSESTSPNTGYSYNGIESTEVSTTLSFPGLYKNYYGFSSEVVLQNTTTTTANVSLVFDNGTAQPAITGSIPGNSSRVFALQDFGQLPSGNSAGKYSLVVTSTNGVALAGVANIWTAAVHGETTSYNAFIGGATTAYAPALYKNYYNFVSALTVQNVSNTTANGTVTYSNGTTETFSLAPGRSVEYYQPNNPNLPSGNTNGVFSAKVVATSGQVVTLVTVEDKIQGLAASYNGSTTASPTVNAPVVLKEYYGYFSAVTVQNVGDQTTTATLTFATGQSRSASIPPNGTYNFIQLTSAGDPLPPNTTTSAVVTSNNGQPLVAVVQENNPTRYAQNGGGDYLFAYTASAQ